MKKLIDYPELMEITEESLEDYILGLYKKLGWSESQNIDPKKILMCEKQWLEICSEFNATEVSGAGFAWMNYGPSCDKDIPYGKIKLEKGYLEEATSI